MPKFTPDTKIRFTLSVNGKRVLSEATIRELSQCNDPELCADERTVRDLIEEEYREWVEDIANGGWQIVE